MFTASIAVIFKQKLSSKATTLRTEPVKIREIPEPRDRLCRKSNPKKWEIQCWSKRHHRTQPDGQKQATNYKVLGQKQRTIKRYGNPVLFWLRVKQSKNKTFVSKVYFLKPNYIWIHILETHYTTEIQMQPLLFTF